MRGRRHVRSKYLVVVACSVCILSAEVRALAAPARVLPASDLLPYFHGSEARRLLRAQQFLAAATALSKLGKRMVGGARAIKFQAQFLRAYALFRGARYAHAASAFEQLGNRYSLLGDYCRLFAARAHLARGAFDKAWAQASSLDKTGTLASDRWLLGARVATKKGKHHLAIMRWEQYRKQGSGKRASEAEAQLRLGQAYWAIGRRAEAVTAWRTVLIEHPLTTFMGEADSSLRHAERRMKRDLRVLSGKELVRQGRVFFRRMRNKRSETIFARALAAKLTPKLRCNAAYLRAKSVFKQRQRDRAEPFFRQAAAWCRTAKEHDLVVKALYNQGRGLSKKGKFLQAARTFLSIERRYPKHSIADDARLRAAEAYVEAGKLKWARRALMVLAKRYPQGDQAHEALWRVAHTDMRKGRFTAASRLLDRMNAMGRETHYYAEGQAHYWKARIAGWRKHPKQARKHYEACIRAYPLSYYALLSFNRLRESSPRQFRRLKKELIDTINSRSSWTVERPRTGNSSFQRGVELARLGLGRYAAREFAAAGLSTRRKPFSKMWTAATLFDTAELWHLSHQVPRRRDHRYKLSYPIGANFHRWRIAYPQAFLEPVQRAAKAHRVSRELIWAVMREESGFVTWIESYANAIGLMQMILPTARAAGGRNGIKVARGVLLDPRKNVLLGATFLSFLQKTFRGLFPLTIAGYNAGQGAVGKWLKRFPKESLDRFIERVPYDQTRRYTKRVLSSLFVYSVLYDTPTIPRIPLSIPKITKVPAFH